MKPEDLEVIRKALELVATGQEGLEYATKKSDDGEYEEAFRMLADVLESYAEVEAALLPFSSQITAEGQHVAETLRDGFSTTVSAYEQRDFPGFNERLQVALLPRYLRWQESLRSSLGKHIIS